MTLFQAVCGQWRDPSHVIGAGGGHEAVPKLPPVCIRISILNKRIPGLTPLGLFCWDCSILVSVRRIFFCNFSSTCIMLVETSVGRSYVGRVIYVSNIIGAICLAVVSGWFCYFLASLNVRLAL